MAYVEWLRVRGALKWTVMIVVILLLATFLVRGVAMSRHHVMGVHEMSLGYFVLAGVAFAMIMATVLGAPFARENDGHLEVALTKPVSRTGLALTTIGIDAAGILAALAVGTVFAIVAHTILYPPYITFHLSDGIALLLGIIAPLAWYAMLAAATASIKRGYGAILGFAWPVAAIVAGLGVMDAQDNPMLALIHDAFYPFSLIDPVAYLHIASSKVMESHALVDPAWLSQMTMLAVLACAYGALAVIQWRRVEA